MCNLPVQSAPVTLEDKSVTSVAANDIFVIPANENRRFLMLVNPRSDQVWIDFDQDPDATNGMLLVRNVPLIFDTAVPVGAVHVLFAAADRRLRIWEGELVS